MISMGPESKLEALNTFFFLSPEVGVSQGKGTDADDIGTFISNMATNYKFNYLHKVDVRLVQHDTLSTC